jgi:hypothetical protein
MLLATPRAELPRIALIVKDGQRVVSNSFPDLVAQAFPRVESGRPDELRGTHRLFLWPETMRSEVRDELKTAKYAWTVVDRPEDADLFLTYGMIIVCGSGDYSHRYMTRGMFFKLLPGGLKRILFEGGEQPFFVQTPSNCNSRDPVVEVSCEDAWRKREVDFLFRALNAAER